MKSTEYSIKITTQKADMYLEIWERSPIASSSVRLVVHMTLPPIFFVQVKDGGCYITGQSGQVHNKIKNALTYFQELLR